MPQGMMFCARAVLYSGWKLNGVPLQSNGLVFMNPFAAEAIMKPLCPVVKSVSRDFERVAARDLRVEHVDRDLVARVHQQRVRVRA